MLKLNNPNILGIVSYRIFPALMGGQKCVYEFYTHLANQTKVILAVTKENDLHNHNGMEILPFLHNHKWSLLNIRFLFKISKIIKQSKIDVIFIEHSYLGWLGYLLKLITKKPFIIRSHNIEAHRFRDLQKIWWRGYEWYEKKIHSIAQHSFFITDQDKLWAINQWHLEKEKCSVATYGTSLIAPISSNVKEKKRAAILSNYHLTANTKLFLFNGTLDYLPNIDALRIIVSEILPELLSRPIHFRIFICGNRLSTQWKEVLKEHPQIIFLGFVENIEDYLWGTDCLLNPVTLGGGIKTKLIDALSNNLTCITSFNCANGIPDNLTNHKLIKIKDYNWSDFANKMLELDISVPIHTPISFYEHFNWQSIVNNALLSLHKS